MSDFQQATYITKLKTIKLLFNSVNYISLCCFFHLEKETAFDGHEVTFFSKDINLSGRQTKQRNQLSLPYQDDCKTRMDIK